MSRTLRTAILGVSVCLAAGSDPAAQAAARRVKRDFPQGTKCPVHLGPVAADDPLVFVAPGSAAHLTFVACDERAVPQVDPFSGLVDYQGAGIDLSIDDLIVVDRAVFNANRLPYAVPDPGVPDSGVPDSYRVDRSVQSCYLDNPPVVDVFRREAATARTSTMPLYERFDGSPRGWTLANAEFALESLDGPNGNEVDDTSQSPSLILARRLRDGSSGRLCSSATVRLSRMTPGREYVIDFSWFASGFVEAGQDILTVSIDRDPASPGGVARRVIRRP